MFTCRSFIPFPKRRKVGAALRTDERDGRSRVVGALRQPVHHSLQSQQVDEFRIVRIGNKVHLWRRRLWWRNLSTSFTSFYISLSTSKSKLEVTWRRVFSSCFLSANLAAACLCAAVWGSSACREEEEALVWWWWWWPRALDDCDTLGDELLLRKCSLFSCTWMLGDDGEGAAPEPIARHITTLGGVVMGALLWANKPNFQ